MFNEYEDSLDLLNVEQLCEILSIGKNYAYQLLNEKEMKAFRIGRTWKVPKQAVEEYILKKSGLIRR